jgi:hypothetical protein
MIERAQLEQMFDGIREREQWDLDGPLLWGFFFTATTPEPLDLAAHELEAAGYRFVEIFSTVPEDSDGPETWWLQVARVEHLTLDALDARNRELAAFATAHGLSSYDGMDVGAAPEE